MLVYCTIYCCTVQSAVVLYNLLLYCKSTVVLYNLLLYCKSTVVLYNLLLYCTINYCTVQSAGVLYNLVLYCTICCCTVQSTVVLAVYYCVVQSTVVQYNYSHVIQSTYKILNTNFLRNVLTNWCFLAFEENLVTDVWTKQITSLSTENNFTMCKIILSNLIFKF
jgi:hypothetical protein